MVNVINCFVISINNSMKWCSCYSRSCLR